MKNSGEVVPISFNPTRRGIVVLALIIATAFSFWYFSRYPDLGRKAQMAEAVSSIGDISPWPIVSVDAHAPFLERWALTTLNWVHANMRGMTFGLAIAAMVLTLVNYFPTIRRGSGPLANSALGVAIGVPLGLCVNCSAPVFKSALRTGRIETAFAIMLSSPALNIVVLTMVFSLFPLYMALTKVAVSLMVLFVAVPLLSRAFGPKHRLVDLPTVDLGSAAAPATDRLVNESWAIAIAFAFADFVRRFAHLALRLIPLMVFAGSLGALLVLLHPTANLAEYSGMGAILATAAIGVVLPVPIAFDVMLASSLASQGLPTPVVLTMLCTLGSFSILAFLFVASSASKRWAFALVSVFFGLGTCAGLMADQLHARFLLKPALNQIGEPTPFSPGQADAAIVASGVSAESAPAIRFADTRVISGVRVSRAAFRPAAFTTGSRFVQHEGPALGLNAGFKYDVRDYSDPFWIGRGTASGDINKDGWPDVAFGSNDGVLLYVNRGGRFEQTPLRNSTDNHLLVYAVAFVDMDNDGWLDLVFTSFNQGNYLLFNHEGDFDYSQRIRLPNNAGVLTVSPAFADIDNNGLLDIVNGNMALGVVTGSNHMLSGRANSLVFNGGKQGFHDVALETESGETMSTLVSDLNNDGYLDIYFANDFVAPDKILLGTANGFTEATAARTPLHHTPFFSMSADTGDFDNDQKLDLLSFGTTATAKDAASAPIDGVEPAVFTAPKWPAEVCNTIQDEKTRSQCRKVRETDFLAETRAVQMVDIARCKALPDVHQVKGCLLVGMWHLITHHVDAKECRSRFGGDELIGEVCDILVARQGMITARETNGSVLQQDGNFLFHFDGTKQVDVNSETPGSFHHPGGWTWNARFVDLDNDGLLDIFNADGAVRGNGFGFNVFMKNIDGQRFEQRQFSYGLTDDFGLYSFTLADYDADGDLDIIANSAVGPVRVFENRATQNNRSIAVSLQDAHGNRFGIGAKVTVSFDNNAKHLLREIKASGGYMSFDEPVASFGLGQAATVDEIRVRWRDGSESVIPGPVDAGYHYRIERI